MPAHPSFADWYRSAAVTPPEGLLEKRWAGIEALAKEASPALVVKLARLFVLPNAEDLVPAGFRDAFKKHDDAFPNRDAIQELRVLAGATLRTIIEQHDAYALLAALSLTCGAFGPRRTSVPEQNHVEFAERLLTAIAQSSRNIRGVPLPNVTVHTKKQLAAELLPAGHFAANQTQNLHEPLTTILGELGAGLASFQQAMQGLNSIVQVQAEEINVLWWVQASFSRILQRSFVEIDRAAAPIILSSELAELTTLTSGLESTTAILAHALAPSTPSEPSARVTIAAAVNATPPEWRGSIKASRDLKTIGVLCPISLALDKSLDTDEPNDWLPVYKKACNVPVDMPFDRLQLAVQLYLELMLLRELDRHQT